MFKLYSWIFKSQSPPSYIARIPETIECQPPFEVLTVYIHPWKIVQHQYNVGGFQALKLYIFIWNLNQSLLTIIYGWYIFVVYIETSWGKNRLYYMLYLVLVFFISIFPALYKKIISLKKAWCMNIPCYHSIKRIIYLMEDFGFSLKHIWQNTFSWLLIYIFSLTLIPSFKLRL